MSPGERQRATTAAANACAALQAVVLVPFLLFALAMGVCILIASCKLTQRADAHRHAIEELETS